MQQSKLSFTRISAESAQQQRVAVAEEWKRSHPAEASAAAAAEPLAKRGPGRPPKKRDLAAADAAAPQPAAHKKPRTGNYTNWFSSPYINDVLATLHLHGYRWK